MAAFLVTGRVCAGCLLTLSLLMTRSAQASEKDELACAQRMLTQVQAALARARIAAVQASSDEHARFYFDYRRATDDLNTINAGIDSYLMPSRAQPHETTFVAGNYRRERP